MASELLTGISLFKSMFDMAKGLMDMNNAADRHAALIELQREILAAQEQQATLVEHVGDLEKEVTRLKAWEREKKREHINALVSEWLAFDFQGWGDPRRRASSSARHQATASCYAARPWRRA